ncbi:MAG: GTP 3',8-cyclase MoaA, partial [Candidatus Hydrogenedentota bacterium]
RVSVTDLCNYRCTYCMPPEGVKRLPHSEILTFEEICSVVGAAIPLGINRVRLTGGEPLVRREIPKLVRMLTHLPGIEEVYLTTNGSFLEELAGALRRSGLSRINVSLDSLRPERYQHITRGGCLKKVWRGIEVARRIGFDPIKLNVVVIEGVNDDEIEDFAAFTRENPVEVRFIEYMPFGPLEVSARFRYVTVDEMRKRISAVGNMQRLPGMSRSGPAERHKLEGAKGVIGFIPAMSHSFCSTCNRIRLTADGRLLSCLFSGQSVEVKSLLRSGAAPEKISDAIRLAIRSKPSARSERCENFMSSIGG